MIIEGNQKEKDAMKVHEGNRAKGLKLQEKVHQASRRVQGKGSLL